MRFLVLNNENGLGTAKELIINWESVKYIRPSSSSVFFMELNNGSSIKLTVNAGNSSVVIDAINTAIKSRSNSNRVIPIQQKSIGAFSFTSIQYLEGGNFIDDELTVYVGANGTVSENGQALLDGYQEAVAKIPVIPTVSTFPCVGVFGQVANVYDFYLSTPVGNDFVLFSPYDFVIDLANGAGALNYTFEIIANNSPAQQRGDLRITLNGAPVTDAVLGGLQIPIQVAIRQTVTLLVGPGEYKLPSDLIINDIVSMVSLSGSDRTLITTVAAVNIRIQSGANNSAALTNYKGFGIKSLDGLDNSGNIYVESNLPFITFEDIVVINTTSFYSFMLPPSFPAFPFTTPANTLSSTYIDCSAAKAFGQNTDQVSASGLFVGCWGEESFGANGANITGLFFRCGSSTSNLVRTGNFSNVIPNKQFGYKCEQFNADMTDCIGGNSSFGCQADTITNNASLNNCISTGSFSFGSQAITNRADYVNCISTAGKAFSADIPSGANHSEAIYINCTAEGPQSFGYALDSGSGGSFQGRFINCTTTREEGFGKSSVAGNPNVTTGLLYNCYANDGFAPVSGSGKIRNSLDNTTFSIINLG
jgi:hypothetical protein